MSIVRRLVPGLLILISQSASAYTPADAPLPRLSAAEETALLDKAVRETSPGRYRIAAGPFARVAADDVIRAVRLVPAFKNGVGVGIRVYSIRPGSAPYRLGLRNGDLIVRVNGAPLSDPDEARKVYERLGTAKKVDALLERRGERVELHYDVVRSKPRSPGRAKP